MKSSLFILLIAVSHYAAGQSSVYHPFPDSNAMWNVHAIGYNGGMCSIVDPMYTDYYFSYYISGDTVINNVSYHKIYSSGYSHEHCILDSTVDNWWTWNATYEFAFRQDLNQKKIYFYTNQEYLKYDFSLNVGDTAPEQGCVVISSIDSVLIGMNYRKRFYLSKRSTIFPDRRYWQHFRVK